jgi:CheY-like chemotaxis protein
MTSAHSNSPTHCPGGISSATDATIPDRAITILVVDDDPAVRKLVVTILRKFGLAVLTAPDGEEALRILSATGGPKIDLLLTDYQMPGLRGDELVKRFHEVCPTAGIIMMSAECPDLSRIPQCEFLAKPFPIAALYEKVQAALSKANAN